MNLELKIISRRISGADVDLFLKAKTIHHPANFNSGRHDLILLGKGLSRDKAEAQESESCQFSLRKIARLIAKFLARY